MTFGSLFAGIGGFDLGLERAGMKCLWQVEINPFCRKVLAKHWPRVKKYDDIKKTGKHNLEPVELICGGDPCPIRSRARSIWKTKTPDLSGYFLAVVGKCQPRWVVRENVPASDDVEFAAALEMLGYRTIIVSINAAQITAQNRERDFIVGCPPQNYSSFVSLLPISQNGKRYAETKYEKTPAYPVLTTHSCRWDARDGYIWDGAGIRVADSKERQKLTGFPDGWLDGFSKTAVARMTGNAVVVPVAERIGRIINEANHRLVLTATAAAQT